MKQKEQGKPLPVLSFFVSIIDTTILFRNGNKPQKLLIENKCLQRDENGKDRIPAQFINYEKVSNKLLTKAVSVTAQWFSELLNDQLNRCGLVESSGKCIFANEI